MSKETPSTLSSSLTALLQAASAICDRREEVSEEYATGELVAQASVLLKQLDALECESKGSPTERALALCVRGKLLDVAPKFNLEAEQALTRAVKLMPSLVEAWNVLGHCYWKKGDLHTAHHCFAGALRKSQNKTSLQQLSMLKRSLAKGDPQKAAQLMEESMQHARDALALDVSDTRSWYCMGNAYLSMYFRNGASDPSILRSSLKAYQNAEKGGEPSKLPDLHFNRAMVHQYLGDHQLALEGFSTAGKLDPSLPWMAEVEAILTLVSRVHEVVEAKGHLKPKRLQQVVSSISISDAPANLRAVGIRDLSVGSNIGTCVQCKIVQGISDKNAVPLYYVLVDHVGDFFAISVLGLDDSAMKSNSVLTLLEPLLKPTTCSWNGKAVRCVCVRVEGPRQILVGGMMPMGFQSSPTLQTTTLS